MNDHLYECAVLGGGVAGAAAACQLARLGYDTLLLEKTSGPHHKVCGEFLSAEAFGVLKGMGVSLDGNPFIKDFILFSPQSEAGFHFGWPGCGVSRLKLDQALLDAAGHAGADIEHGVCVAGYRRENDVSFTIETNRGPWRARHVFVATGKHDLSPGSRRTGVDEQYLGLKMHLQLSTRELAGTMALFSFPGGYGGISPVEDGAANFCFIIERRVYKSAGGNFNTVVSGLRSANRQLGAVLANFRPAGPLCAIGHIPYGFLRPYQSRDNVYFMGDQRVVFPSVTGDGMATALMTARSCVFEFHARQQGLEITERPMHAILESQMRWAMWAHAILKSPSLTETVMFLSRKNPFLLEMIFQKTRVSSLHEYDQTPAIQYHDSSR